MKEVDIVPITSTTLPPKPKLSDISPSSALPTIANLRKLIARLDASLPTARGRIRRNDDKWSITAVRKAYKELEKQVKPLLVDGGAGLESTEQLDLIRLFSRLTKAIAIGESKVMKEMELLKRSAGKMMAELLEKLSVGKGIQHGRSLATLRIESLGLQQLLPPIQPPRQGLDDEFQSDLRLIFLPPSTDPVTPAKIKSIMQSQRTTLSVLFDSWERVENGSVEAVKFLAGWQLDTIFDKLAGDVEASNQYSRNLRRRYMELVGAIKPSPLQWFLDQSVTLESNPRYGPHLITFLSNRATAPEALEIWARLKGQATPAYDLTHLNTPALLEALLDRGYLLDADRVATYLDHLVRYLSQKERGGEDLRTYYVEANRSLAKAAAMQGRPSVTSEILERLTEAGYEIGMEGVARKMRSRAEEVESQLALVRAEFDKGVKSEGTVLNQARLYGELVRAHVRANNLEGGLKALKDMVEQGIRPTVALFTSLLYGFVSRGDSQKVYEFFDTIEKFDLVPTAATYNALATLHSQRRDPEGVERVIEEMKEAGVVPDLQIWTTLMDSLVEAGQYSASLGIFAFLQNNDKPSLRPDTATLNVALKAGVLTSAPAASLLSLFRQSIDLGIRPNMQTYTLLMHSLCTSGLMTAAEELFTLMDRPILEGELPISAGAIKPDAFIFTTLIYGYLRSYDRLGESRRGLSEDMQQMQMADSRKARAVLNEMRSRGIVPTSVTYGVIIGALLREPGGEGIKQAEASAARFMAASREVVPRDRRAFDKERQSQEAANSIYGPLINAFAKKLLPESAFKHFKAILDNGSEPSVPQHTSLMDAYRRVGETHGVRTVWRRLYDSVKANYARRPSDSVEVIQSSTPTLHTPITMNPTTLTLSYLSPPVTTTASATPVDFFPPTPSELAIFQIDPYHANLLCTPLTVYIDALASDNCLAEIIRTWERLSASGFHFDAGNWNAIALALARDGKYDQAFEIAEYVLCAGEEGDIDVKEEPTRKLFGAYWSERIESRALTSARLGPYRREQDSYRTSLKSLKSLFSMPLGRRSAQEVDEAASTKSSGIEVERKKSDFASIVLDNARIRQRQYWFMHSSLVTLLDKILRSFGGKETRVEGEENEVWLARMEREREMRRGIEEKYPRAVRKIQRRKAEMQNMEMIRRERE